MTYNAGKHHRRSIRLKEYDYSQAGAYFITICAYKKKCVFGEIVCSEIQLSPFGNIAYQYWLEILQHFENVQLDTFVVMPNHIHGIIIVTHNNNVGAIHELPLQRRIQRRKMLIPKIVGYYKMNSTKAINQVRNTPGIQIWQRNYYEHVIRNEAKLNHIREYIFNNPLQWQFDRENPRCVEDKAYINQWGHLEETIYGRQAKKL